MEYVITRSEELQHHGILGQKWGVRRYQNPDGTLTEAGLKRYNRTHPYQNPDGSLNEAGKKNLMKAAKSGKLEYGRLPDNELDMINNRFNKENAYKRNVENYEKSTFKYKMKEAVISRVKGKGNGGGGGGGGGGGKGIGSLFAMPIKKALEDAMKFDAGKGNGGSKDDDYSDDARQAKQWRKHGHRICSNYVDKAKWPDVERGKMHFEKKMRDFGVNSNSGGRMGTYDSGPTSYAERMLAERRAAKHFDDDDGIVFAVTRIRQNELMHYGILGQKWGVRRFQNVDGTWTAEGKERYGAGHEYDKKVKSGEFQDDPELKELYIMEKRELTNGNNLSDKERNLANKALSGQPLSKNETDKLKSLSDDRLNKNFALKKKQEQILRNNDAWSKVRDQKTFSKKDQEALDEINSELTKNRKAYAELKFATAKAAESKYAQEIKNESDNDWVDPAYRKFSSKEEKAKAEEAYLERLSQDAPSGKESKWNREVGHISNKVSNLSMDGYDGIPKSKRQKAEFDYVDTDDSFDRYDNWVPKYEKSREFKALQEERAKIKDLTGVDKKRKAYFTETSEKKREQLWQEYIKASRLYSERTKGIDAKEKAMYQKHKEKLIKNLCIDLGYEPTEKNMAYLAEWSWYD